MGFKNLGKDTLYLIETNNGSVGFDLYDTSLVDRIESMYDRYEKAQKNFEQNQALIDKKGDRGKNKLGMNIKDRETIDNFNKFVKDVALILNSIFGNEAHKKIFFDSDLKRPIYTLPRIKVVFEEILPQEFEKAGVKQNKYMEEELKPENREKYLSKDEEIKVLD